MHKTHGARANPAPASPSPIHAALETRTYSDAEPLHSFPATSTLRSLTPSPAAPKAAPPPLSVLRCGTHQLLPVGGVLFPLVPRLLLYRRRPLQFSFSQSPSPFHHRLLSPLRAAAAASAVPFAWEHRPGVPRTPVRQLRSSTSSRAAKGTARLPLPLPPSRVVLSGTGRKVGAEDYSFTALTDVEGGAKERLGRRVRRQTALAAATLTDCLAVLSLCRQSCTMSRDCLVGTPPPQRPREMPGKGAVVGCSGY